MRHPTDSADLRICPVAYQMSSSCRRGRSGHRQGTLRELRRRCCGEWIESHVLHMVMLHAPDFHGFPDVMTLAKHHPERVQGSLQIKKAGNAIVATLGGREIHPVNVKVGGFYRAPRRGELDALLPLLRGALDEAEQMLDWLATFTFPTFERDYELVSLRHPSEYPMNEGRLVSTKGLDIEVHDLLAHIEEHQVPYSTALHARMRARGSYQSGPLARFVQNTDRLSPRAAAAAARVGLDPSCRNPFRMLLARGVETIYALDEAIRIIDGYTPPAVPAVAITLGAGTGHAITEAPRGILYHRYVIGDDGIIEDAQIIPPTSQNQRGIEEDLFAMGEELASLPLDQATRRAEHAIRNYDPCISCSTHFLTLKLEQRGDG
jgi:coenzyme F420-reducing hydrogenase alpha subunit